MKVELITHTPNPEKIIAIAAKLCYSTCSIEDLSKKIDDATSTRLINMLMEMGHESVFEHITFTFAIEGVSRSLLAQITRHRMASFSVQSQRYCNLSNTFSFITPSNIENDEVCKEIFNDTIQKEYEAYLQMVEVLKQKNLRMGLDNKSAEKSAIEDARAILPNACETKMLVTMNARSLMNFFSLRCCNRAQEEIRTLAWEMLKQCQEVAPNLFKTAGAPCLRGKCPEGKMSCGHPYKIK